MHELIKLDLPRVRGWAVAIRSLDAPSKPAHEQALVVGVALDRIVEAIETLERKAERSVPPGLVAASPRDMGDWKGPILKQGGDLAPVATQRGCCPYLAQVERRCRGALVAIGELERLLPSAGSLIVTEGEVA